MNKDNQVLHSYLLNLNEDWVEERKFTPDNNDMIYFGMRWYYTKEEEKLAYRILLMKEERWT